MPLTSDFLPRGPIDTVESIDREATEMAAGLGWGLGVFTAVFSATLDQLLLVQLGDYAAGRCGGRPWTLPGGGVEAGETPSHAAVRGVLEECGLDLRVDLRHTRRRPTLPAPPPTPATP